MLSGAGREGGKQDGTEDNQSKDVASGSRPTPWRSGDQRTRAVAQPVISRVTRWLQAGVAGGCRRRLIRPTSSRTVLQGRGVSLSSQVSSSWSRDLGGARTAATSPTPLWVGSPRQVAGGQPTDLPQPISCSLPGKHKGPVSR